MKKEYTEKEMLTYLTTPAYRNKLLSYINQLTRDSINAHIVYDQVVDAVLSHFKRKPDEKITNAFIRCVIKRKVSEIFRNPKSANQTVSFKYWENGEIKETTFTDPDAELKRSVALMLNRDKYIKALVKSLSLNEPGFFLCLLIFNGYDIEEIDYKTFSKLYTTYREGEITAPNFRQIKSRLKKILYKNPTQVRLIIHNYGVENNLNGI